MPGVRLERSIVLAAGLRSPFARAGGAFAGEDPAHLGARMARELLARTGVDPAAVDEVIAGCVGAPSGQANVGRVLALRAGLPERIPARTVARNCASGIEMVTQAATEIEAGRGTLYLCVGVEVMSAYPLHMGPELTGLFGRLSRARTAGARLAALASFRPAHLKPRVAVMEGLTDPVSGLVMGRTAEVLARDFDITREESDRFAARSHNRAQEARDAGLLAQEIVPHLGLAPGGAREGARALEHDDGIRDGQSVEALARLRPYFEKPDGQVTVGNACGLTDGAVALLVTTEERARELNLTPLARLRGYAWAGCEPARMGLGPVFSTAKVLAATGCELADMSVVELNEAFAAQVLACQRAFDSDAFARENARFMDGRERRVGELDPARLNPNGGAIALGHPVGATGGRLLLTAACELRRADGELALATLCIGGGQGGAVVLERTGA